MKSFPDLEEIEKEFKWTKSANKVGRYRYLFVFEEISVSAGVNSYNDKVISINTNLKKVLPGTCSVPEEYSLVVAAAIIVANKLIKDKPIEDFNRSFHVNP